MVKAYLRYRFDGEFGVITSSESNSVLDNTGTLAITAANEFLSLVDPRTGLVTTKLSTTTTLLGEKSFICSNSTTTTGSITRIAAHPSQTNICAVGYIDGSIRLWDTFNQLLLLTLHGHKSAISFLEFSLDGHCLATGGCDTDIVIWDLVNQSGLFRLRGHRNQITSLKFLYSKKTIESSFIQEITQQKNEFYETPKKKKRCREKQKQEATENTSSDTEIELSSPTILSSKISDCSFLEFSRSPVLLISGSKDGTIKVWDLSTQWCVQTVFDSSSEISSLSVNPTQTCLFVGSTDHQLKIFSLNIRKHCDSINTNGTNEAHHTKNVSLPGYGKIPGDSSIVSVIEYLGAINRPDGRGRATQLIYAIDVDDLANSFKTACAEGEQICNLTNTDLQGMKPVDYSTKNGTLFTGTDSHVASKNSRQVLLLVCPSTRAIEIYREFTPAEQKAKFRRRKRRAMEKLKKKQSRLEEVKKLCESLDSVLKEGLRTGLGTTYECEKETSVAQLESLTLEIEELRRDSNENSPNVSDQFQYIHTFYLKKKPVSVDYCNLNWSLLVSYGDNTLEVFTLPLDLLVVKKGPPQKITECQGDRVVPNEALVPNSTKSSTSNEIILSTAFRVASTGHTTAPRTVGVSHDDCMIITLAEKNIHIWKCDNHSLIRHLTSPEVLTCGFFIAGNGHVVVGTLKGSIMIYDIMACTTSEKLEKIHDGAVVAIAEHPRKTGFATVSTDKLLRFFQFHVAKSKDSNTELVGCKQIGDAPLMDEGLDVKFSPNGKYIAVSLLDFTIQLFYADTVKLFLTLYGHKLPAPSIDISSNSTLLVSGSGDKTIKLWGMDFGNIQKSWHAHDEGVTQVLFLKDTHYVVSTGKDCLIKIWDTDRRDLICQLVGHTKAVTSLTTTRLDADRIIAGGLDRSVRVWKRTDEQIFAAEEQEKILEEKLDREAARADMPVGGGSGAQEVVMTRATRRTVESIKSTEQLMEVIDIATTAWKEQQDYREALATWILLQEEQKKTNSSETIKSVVPMNSMSMLKLLSEPTPPSARIEMAGLSPHRYLFNALATLTAPVIHEVVISLPFSFAEKLLLFVGSFLKALSQTSSSTPIDEPDQATFLGLHSIEIVARITLLIVHLHMRQFLVSSTYRECLLEIHKYLRPVLLKEKERLEFNSVALHLLLKRSKENQIAMAFFR